MDGIEDHPDGDPTMNDLAKPIATMLVILMKEYLILEASFHPFCLLYLQVRVMGDVL